MSKCEWDFWSTQTFTEMEETVKLTTIAVQEGLSLGGRPGVNCQNQDI